MQMRSIKEGDEVKCNVRGRQFPAKVEEKHPGELVVTPLVPNITYFRVTAKQVERVIRRGSSERGHRD